MLQKICSTRQLINNKIIQNTMYILFDIGATNLRLANSVDGKSLGQTKTLPTPQNFDEAIQLLETEIAKLGSGQTITGIVGGIAGRLNQDKTTILHATNLQDWSNKPLATKLANIFNCSVKLENDCAVGALGESRFGAAQDYNSSVYIAVGTGIGGAWILNNQLVQGSYSFGIGHQVIDPNGPLCPAHQQPGHLESYIREPDFKKYFIIGLYNTILHWPTDVIILGGGVVLGANWQADEIQKGLEDLTKGRSYNIPVKIASLGDEAGLYGALALINQATV